MSTHVTVYFKFEGRMCSLTLKASSVEEISLSMVEAKMYKKLGLDERNVKLELNYIPLVFGCEEEIKIQDDDEMLGYLTTIDKDNRRSLLNVEAISSSEHIEQLSRVGKSSVGMNYEEVRPHDDEIEPNAITLYVENDKGRQENEVMQGNNDECVDTTVDTTVETGLETVTGMDILDMGDEYVEPPRYEEPTQFREEWDDGLNLSVGQEYPSRNHVSELVDRGAFVKSFGYVIIKSDLDRWVVKCSQAKTQEKNKCRWGIRAARIPNTDIFSIRTYTNKHTCSRPSHSTSNNKRRGSKQLVASLLNEEYPGQMQTPTPKLIKDIVKRKLGVDISYSTALRGKNEAISVLRGTPEDSYKMLYQYLYMLEVLNPGTVSDVKLDDNGKFKYLFIALGACIEGFRCMRKVIIVDATFLKNGYGGSLVFATAQDPNRHHYPLAFGVLDGENNASWTWFFERLKSVIPDSSELVFMSDRNSSLISAIGNVFPLAHHGHCIWHLSQNVKGHTSNVNKATVTWRFMELSRYYTVAEFNSAYESFKRRYPTAINYLEESIVKEKWARCHFEGDKYNLDTSNSVESMNSVFNDARKYSLIPMLDTIIQKFSDWFNEHRKDAVSGSMTYKLVPFVENTLHNLCDIAEKLLVREVNSYELEYEVVGEDGRLYLVNLMSKSCSCRVFDIEKYPCVHAI